MMPCINVLYTSAEVLNGNSAVPFHVSPPSPPIAFLFYLLAYERVCFNRFGLYRNKSTC